MAGAKPGYRPDIDGLRAIAVCSVVAYHAAPNLAPGGFIGVDVFFVISGFLISGIIFADLEVGKFSFLNFYLRRVRRILPPLLAVLVAVWVAGWFILMPEDYSVLGLHLSAASVFVSNFVLGQEAGYFDKSAELKPLLHLWSLAVEEQFYLLWPAAAYCFWKWRANLTLCLAVLLLASFTLHVFAVREYPTWDFYSLPTRLWELGLGAMLALFKTPSITARLRESVGIVGGSLVLISVFASGGVTEKLLWLSLLSTAGAAMLILAGPLSIAGRALSLTPIVWVGLISYPLYLWHWPLFSFARIASLGEPSPTIKGLLVVASFALAYATYRYIEPVRYLHGSGWRGQVPQALLGVLAIVGIAGLATIAADGFPRRYPDPVRSLAAYKYDLAGYGRACLLSAEQDASHYGKSCDGRSASTAERPLILLWGDSHAAQLRPGLLEIGEARGHSVAQFNSNACPPILGLEVKEHPYCVQNNEFALEKIKELRPQVIVMAGQWWAMPEAGFSKLETTLSTLTQIPYTKSIVLVGPVPVWNPSLPARLIDYYRTSVPKHVPDRMQGASLFPAIDVRFEALAARDGVALVLPSRVFCTNEGCATRASQGTDMEPLAWDSAHLTSAGSRAVAMAIYEALSAKAPTQR